MSVPKIRWTIDADGDHECRYFADGRWQHWGIVCPHHGPGKFKTSANWGDYSDWYRTLGAAKTGLESQLIAFIEDPASRPAPVSPAEMMAKMRSKPDWEEDGHEGDENLLPPPA